MKIEFKYQIYLNKIPTSHNAYIVTFSMHFLFQWRSYCILLGTISTSNNYLKNM
jgi:hypothetical protein